MVNFVNPVTNMKPAGGGKLNYLHNITIPYSTEYNNYEVILIQWVSEDQTPITSCEALYNVLKNAGFYDTANLGDDYVNDSMYYTNARKWYPALSLLDNLESGDISRITGITTFDRVKTDSTEQCILIFQGISIDDVNWRSYSVNDVVSEV